MQLHSKTISVQLEDTYLTFELMYNFQVIDGTLAGGVSVSAVKEGRQVAFKNTQDGINFSGSINDQEGDDLDGLNHELNINLKVLLVDWGTYV